MWGYYFNLIFERFKMSGVSDLGVSLDVNELFRLTQAGLAVAGSPSSVFYIWNVFVFVDY